MRNYTFFDEYGVKVPNALKDLVAQAMGRSGQDMLGDDPNLQPDTLLYRMATQHEYLAPLRAFEKRRLLANLDNDLMVPLGTAAFLPAEEVRSYREKFAGVPGIVHTLVTHPVSPTEDAQSCASEQCEAPKSNALPLDEMRASLDGVGWEKTIVNFKGVLGVFPMAHNQIAAVTKFTTEIDKLLGFHEGRFLMDNAAKWLLS